MYVAIKINNPTLLWYKKVTSKKYVMEVRGTYACVDEAEIVHESASKRVRFPIQKQCVCKNTKMMCDIQRFYILPH